MCVRKAFVPRVALPLSLTCIRALLAGKHVLVENLSSIHSDSERTPNSNVRKLKILIDSSDDVATKNMRKLQKLIKNKWLFFWAEGTASIAMEDVCE